MHLYSITTNKEALRALARAMREWLDETGNFAPQPAVFPNWVAPVVRSTPGGARQAIYMRWGFPPQTIQTAIKILAAMRKQFLHLQTLRQIQPAVPAR